MKLRPVAVLALGFLQLLSPCIGFAQHENSSNNQVGLFLNSNGTGQNCTTAIAVGVPVYLVLINPTDEQNADQPYTTINAFECMLNFTGGRLFKLADTLPPTAVNIGDNSDINQGFLEYIVGLGTPLGVTSGSATLISFQFMATSPAISEITLTRTSAPGIADEMAYQSVDGQLRAMHNASGIDGGLEFVFGYCGLPVETESFGSVKALYR